MYKKDIDSLLNKGKHYVCHYVTAGCYDQDTSTINSLDEQILLEKHISEHDHRRINQVIDYLFDFRQNYTSEELIEWVKYLICGRRLPINFAKDVKQYDRTSKCTLVWTNNFVAYRCRTCAISLCMSLCADCFFYGYHKGHDFNMFRSQAGGACDCGDSTVLKPEGFCRKHQPRDSDSDDVQLKKKIPPNSLLCIANETVPRLLHYLLLYLRGNNFTNNKKANALINDILIYLCDLGTLMQTIICNSLTDPNSYKSFLKLNKEDDLDYQHYLKTLSKNYRNAVQELELSSIFPDLGDLKISDLSIVDQIESFKSDIKHETYLDEIIFWVIYYEFPSNLVTFLLKMLPNDDYKAHFAHCFVKHYFRISMLILHPTRRFNSMNDKDIANNKLANAIVHISVQLFSNENLARELCEKSYLLYIIILSLKFAICGDGKNFWGILKVNSELDFEQNNDIETENNKDKRPNVHRVVRCDHPILRYHRFWPLNSDLNNLFTHKRIAHMFLKDNDLIDVWLEFIMAFQTMNLNLKSTKADDTNQNYKSSFPAEVEIASSQMWTLISQLNDEDTIPLTINFIQRSINWLRKWLYSISFDINLIDTDRCTFHLPLHRYYSIFLNHAVNQNASLKGLLPTDRHELKDFMVHPLQTLIVSNHIMANTWFSSGPHIKTQALNYMHPHFCNSKIDADLFLVQQIAAQLDPDEFVKMFFCIYGLNEHLNLTPLPENDIDKNRLIIFLENGFGLFATILGVQLNLGLSACEVTRKEMVSLLAVSDKTHSQIQDMMPRRWGTLPNNAFIEILQNIAEYKSPEVEVNGSLVQGYFYPKNDVWQNEYDPLFVLYRNAQRREFQASLERFASFAKQSGKYESNSLPWPPFRIPPLIDDRFIDPRIILKSKTLHAYFFSILYRSLNDTVSITQHLMSIVIHLIELTLNESMKSDSCLCLSDLEKPENIYVKSVNEFEFSSWYPSADILSNFITIIRKTELSLTKNSDQIKTKIIASLFSLLMPDDQLNPFSHLEEYDNGPIIAIDNEDDNENVINVNESENESGDPDHNSRITRNDSSNNNNTVADSNVLFQINPSSIAPMLSFYIDGEEIPDVIIREAKHLDRLMNDNTNTRNNTTTDSADELSSIDSSQPSSLEYFSNQLSNEPSTSSQQQQQHLPAEKRLIIKTKPFKFKLDVNESILTLLLRLHSKLSEKRDSFKTDSKSLEKYDLNSRIGDGPYFIGCLLKRFIYTCAKRLESRHSLQAGSCLNKVIEFIDHTRRSIWPTINKAASPIPTTSTNADIYSDGINSMDIDQDELQRSEKKRKALERKKQIMSKFCLLQNEFIKNNKSTFEKFNADESEQEYSFSSNTAAGSNVDLPTEDNHSRNSDHLENTSNVKYQPKTYQCVICMDTGASILERPFVQMVLLQSSSILNNAFAHTLADEFVNSRFVSENIEKLTTIPTTKDDYCIFKERKTFAHYFEHKIDRLFPSFALDSWLSSFNIGWCGGVHAQSCGHFMHMDCYQSYISSVYQDRDSNDLIEYPCPLCRKVANSVLPIIPNLPHFPLVQSRKNDDPSGVAVEILNLLSNCDQARLANTTEDDSKFLKVLAMAIEDVLKATEPQYRNIRVDPCPQSLFLFLSSISRTNLEYNIVLWRKSLPLNQNASCLVPLFHALSLNAKLVLPMYYMKLWAQITGVDADEIGSHLMPYEKQVPLLIKDVSAILLQFLYALPFNIDKAYFLSIVKALLNLNFIQAIVMMTFLFSPDEKLNIKTLFETKNNGGFNGYLDYVGFIINSFEATILNSSIIGIENRKSICKQSILESLSQVCLPFLRLAAMIFHLLFNQTTLPEINDLPILDEFTTLADYLCLNSMSSSTMKNELESSKSLVGDTDDTFFKPYINWMCNPSSLITTWYSELDKLIQTNPMAASSLIKENCVISSQPKLLRLPKVYEQLFMFYHKRPCETCNNVPKDPSLCLICGQLICIREACCRNANSFEGVHHSRKCGAGTALYLAINSSTIILIRGRKACAWGSVYLDEFGEEDRDLKRGKPLFLCNERYRILEQQWLTHSFLNINKKWIYHKDLL